MVKQTVAMPDKSYRQLLEKAVHKNEIRSVDVEENNGSHQSLQRLAHRSEWERKYNSELQDLNPTRSFVESSTHSKLSKNTPIPKLDLHLNTASFLNPNSIKQIVEEYPSLMRNEISEYDFCRKFKMSAQFLEETIKPVLEIIQLPQLKVNPPDEKTIEEFSHDFKLSAIDPHLMSERTSPTHERLHKEIRKRF